MRISWNWLKQYVHTDLTPQEASAVLTSTGLEVESVELHEPVKGMLEGVVVGQVLECGKHPDADRLSVCSVDLGSGEPAQIVCGAPNVAKGQKVLVATVGSTLNMSDGNSITIRKSKIRGVESQGMICAEDELGLGTSHAGIMILDAAPVIGKPASQQLGLVSDHVLEIGLTPNRTDAMGHVGVARDLIAALNHRTGSDLKLLLPDITAFAVDGEERAVPVEVKDTAACPRYAGLTLTSVRVGPSPAWLQDRLKTIGLKPINNVVDVTNFVQHELAQPLHAFDADRLEGGRIVVRRATDKERFITLDGKERTLHTDDLVIADAVKPACIAGVFGGHNSGVTESTTTVFLESACFDPGSIRRTARRHGLNTDASFRFERGVDPEITVYALKRAALLLKEVAGARITSAIIDIDHTSKQRSEINLRFAELEKLSGLRLEHDAVVRILELLDFTIRGRDAEGLQLTAPAYRADVNRPVDVIEEVLRIHGFDHVPLPDRLLCPPVLQSALTPESLGQQVAAHFAARGFREIMTPSLVNGERTVASGTATTADLVTMANPLSSELDVLRPDLLDGALRSMAHNINRQQRDLRFFERGRTYRITEKGITETPVLAISITGKRWRDRWRAEDRTTELADVKEELESLLERLGLASVAAWEPVAHPVLRNAHAVQVKGTHAGVIGEVDPAHAKRHEVAQSVFHADLNETVLLDACGAGTIVFAELARFPSVRRDLSLLLPVDARFDQLRKVAMNAERKLLREVDLFDVYEGNKLPAGRKSYALSFILQDNDKTLTDEQVEKAMGRIRLALEKEVGAELRA